VLTRDLDLALRDVAFVLRDVGPRALERCARLLDVRRGVGLDALAFRTQGLDLGLGRAKRSARAFDVCIRGLGGQVGELDVARGRQSFFRE
jgi:hypothetical protein